MTIRRTAVFPPETGQFRRDRVGSINAGGCTLCRSSRVSEGRPAVELGNNARPFREGMVVVCFNCATEIGTQVGMLSMADAEQLRAEVADLRRVLNERDEQLSGFSHLNIALTALKAMPTLKAMPPRSPRAS